MPTVSGIRFDSIRLTALTESNPRDQKLDVLQVHHGTIKSLSGLESLMDPGGRTVSANGALSNTGELVLKVPINRRAFTSASQTDERSFTVETCNTSYAPDWGISSESHNRLSVLLYDLHKEFGVPLRRGIPGLIGHNEVPGTYPTACPGPSMDLNRILRGAIALKELEEADSEMALTEETKNWLRELVETRIDQALTKHLKAENKVLTARDRVKNPAAEKRMVDTGDLISATAEDTYILTNLDKYPDVAKALVKAIDQARADLSADKAAATPEA